MSEVTKLTTVQSEVKRRDAINNALTDLQAIADLLQIASATALEAIDPETITHAAAMLYDRAAKLQHLMAEGDAS